MIDVVVVGSGASAVHAAWPLVKAGLRVVMADVGEQDSTYHPLIPKRSFEEIRLTDPEQHRYFLGDDFEGIPFGPVRVGAQLTPPRQHISRVRPGLLPIESDEFHAMQSLAVGGLAAGWGAATPHFLDEDIEGWPIGRADLQPHYDAVTERVGICGTHDDLDPFFGPSPGLLEPPRIDSNAACIYHRYKGRRGSLNRAGFHMGESRLAMVTKPRSGDRGLRNFDMEFWSDRDRAVYRPVYTLEQLRRESNFEYRPRLLVEKVARNSDGTMIVEARNVESETSEAIRCGRVVLAAGAIGTARIALRSLGVYNTKVPLLANPYTYYPCVVWAMVGRAVRDRRHSLTQLMIYFDHQHDRRNLLQAQIYSYRSLLTFKLMKEAPLSYRDSLRLMQLLQSYFVIVGVHHEDRPGPHKTLMLQDSGGGAPTLHIAYNPTRSELEKRLRLEKQLMRFFPRLGCLPIKRIFPGEGSSIHYGGSLPMTKDDRPLTTRPDGSLRDMDGVYIADGASFPHLPAKGLTFTLMANANRVGSSLAAKITEG